MKLKLRRIALPWLALAVLMPVLALSLTAVPAEAGCPCEGGGTPAYSPPVTEAIRVDVSPSGAGDVTVERYQYLTYPVVRNVVLGESVHLEAFPAEGYYFAGWGGSLSSSENPVYVKVNEEKIITAHFFPEEIASDDSRLRLVFPVGTAVQDGEGQPLAGLEIAVSEAPPSPPPEASIVGLPYELGPHGATFGQPVTLSFGYDPAEIPNRVAEEELYLAYYDEEAAQWLVLPSEVDTDNHIVTTLVDHLSTFAVVAPLPPPLPASFTISSLSISPTEAEIGETVNISVLVTNAGEMEGSYSLIINLNSVVAEVREITMAGGSQEVVFSMAGDEAGTYSVAVNGLEDSFTVLEPPLLPIALPKAVVWVILGLAMAALMTATVVLPVSRMRRGKD